MTTGPMGMMWTVGPGTFRLRSVHLGMVLKYSNGG